MMRTGKGRLARRCATGLALVGVAAWSSYTLVDARQNATAQQFANEQYQAQLQNHYGHHSHMPIGNVEELFARVR